MVSGREFRKRVAVIRLVCENTELKFSCRVSEELQQCNTAEVRTADTFCRISQLQARTCTMIRVKFIKPTAMHKSTFALKSIFSRSVPGKWK